MKQNITLSLDKDLLTRVRVLAARRSVSVSRLLVDELAGLMEEVEQYEQARRAALATIDKSFHLGGRAASRDALHER